MIVTLKDGSKKEYAEAKSVIDIAYDISEGLARAACAGEVNGEVVDLRTVIDSDCELNILTAKDEKGLAVLRHTASHVLAQAVQTLFPDAKVAIGPSIDTGFYYDFAHEPFSREDLDAIEKEMKKIIKKGAKIERFTKSREDAIAYFKEKNEPYKVELIGDGIHIHPVTVRNTFRLFGDSRVVLISDSMMATGMENGLYELGGQEVTMKDRKATLADGTIAGSATCLFDCMKCVISMGVPEREAILAATANPARSIGIYNEVGSLTPGKRADIVLTDEELNIVKVL